MEKIAKNNRIDENTGVPRADWAANQELISNAAMELLEKEKRVPSNAELARITGLDEHTVSKHIDELTLEKIAKPYRVYAGKVMTGLTAQSAKGDPAAVKLWNQLVMAWKEATSIDLNIDFGEICKLGAFIIHAINKTVTNPKEKEKLLRAIKEELKVMAQ
jgi:DNA-binding transcriptional regulator YhcF (GntR family)